MTTASGKAWVFGDEINSDVMAPGIYFKESMEVMASHCLEAVDPDFASNVQPGDIVVGVNGRAIDSSHPLVNLLKLLPADGNAELLIVRAGREIVVTVPLA